MGIYKTRHGTIEISGDPRMEGRLLREGEYMFKDIEVCLKYATGCVVDVGAHVGLWTVPLAQNATSVVSIEAHPDTAAILKRNIKRNNLSNVVVHEVIIGDPSKTYQRSRPGTPSGQNYYLEGSGEPSVSLDSLIHEKVDFIKIDVEGMEPEVLSGAKELISRYRPTIFLEINPRALQRQGKMTADIGRLLGGYRWYRFNEENGLIRMPFLMNSFYNLLAIPREQKCQPKSIGFATFIFKTAIGRIQSYYSMKKIESLRMLRSVWKSFFVYKKGFAYLNYRFRIAPKILRMSDPLERPITHEGLSMHMLTSHQDMLIAMWSLASFYATSEVIGHLTIHNDGTLTKHDIKIINRLFPNAHVVHAHDFLGFHAHELEEFPHLLEFRKTYKRFQSKKLIDVYFERRGDIVLYLDSDLLWFKSSPEIKEFVKSEARGRALMMSNGAERVHVNFKDGTKTTDEIAECNSGVTLFNAKDYDLAKLAEYIDKCDYLNLKFTDQACFGTILPNVTILPREKYFIKGGITDETIMRHYTGPSREKFFFYGISFIKDKILK